MLDSPTMLDRLSELYVLVALVLVSIVPLWQVIKYVLTPKPLAGIPHLPKQDMIIGDGISMGKHLEKHKSYSTWFDGVAKELSKEGNGGLAQAVFGFGASSRMVIVTDSHEAEDILTRRTHEFDRAKTTIDGFLGLIPEGMIALPTNTKWKHHRRIMGPAMTSKNLGLFAPRANKIISELVDLWKAKSERLGSDGFFDSSEDFAHTMMDAICEISFGESYGSVANSLRQAQAMPKPAPQAPDGSVDFAHEPVELFEAMQLTFNSIPASAPFPAISWYFIKRRPDYRKAIRSVDAFIERKMREGRERVSVRGQEKSELADCVLDLVCAREDGKDRLPDREMRDELYQFLVAGQETSATTLAWAVIFLAKRPDVQRRMRKELLDQGLMDKTPTFADMTDDKLPYLTAVIHESLRMANTAGAVTRMATCDTTILGKRIPKGTTVYFPLTIFGTGSGLETTQDELRSESSKAATKLKPWDPATIGEFEPDRWMADGHFDARAGPSFPFSLGSRGCFGKALAIVEMKLVLAGINLNFFLEAIPEGKQGMDFVEMITRKVNKSYVRPVPW